MQSTIGNLTEKSRTIVLVERHLATELKLIKQLEALNNLVQTMLSQSGVNGLSAEQMVTVNKLSDHLEKEAHEVREKRESILNKINELPSDEQTEPRTLRQFINSIEGPQKDRLESIRKSIWDQLLKIRAVMTGNQAVLFYTFSFYKKMIAGILPRSPEENQYRPNGQAVDVKPGNFYRKEV